MAKFMVTLPFVGLVTHEVEANSPQDAVTKALDLEITSDNMDSCTIGEHFEIDGFDVFATCIEMGRDFDLPTRNNS